MGNRLAETVANDAEAYGYTLTVWGAGGLLIHRYGPPGPWEVVGYVPGGRRRVRRARVARVRGFGERASVEAASLRVASTVHVLSTVGALALAAVLVNLPGLPRAGTFPLVGVAATLGDNRLLLAERLVPERLT